MVIGVAGLLVGLTGKKPSFGGGVVHKYASIIIGVMFVLYSIILFIKTLQQ